MIGTVRTVLRAATHPIRDRWQRRALDRFGYLAWRTGGSLPADIYQQIYASVLRQPDDLDVVEIGAGTGAATIALAWALEESARDAHVMTIERVHEEFSAYAARYGRLRRNLRYFGVSDRVVLYPDALAEGDADVARRWITTERASGLIIDADHRLYRDFDIFYPVLVDGAVVIITRCHATRSRAHRTVHAQVRCLIGAGLLVEDSRLDDVVFLHKPAGASWSAALARELRDLHDAAAG